MHLFSKEQFVGSKIKAFTALKFLAGCMNHFYSALHPFWNSKASVLIHCNCMEKSDWDIIPFCSREERKYRFGTTGWTTNDRIFIFGWTISLSESLKWCELGRMTIRKKAKSVETKKESTVDPWSSFRMASGPRQINK